MNNRSLTPLIHATKITDGATPRLVRKRLEVPTTLRAAGPIQPSAMAGATWSAAGGRGYTGTSSSVSIRVHPWLLPRGASREPVTTRSRFEQKAGKFG